MDIYELIGSAFGLISVYLTMRNNIWCWPTGMVSVLAFAVLFFNSKLYADMLLQIFFFVTSAQGWYYWRRGGAGHSELPITLLTRRQIGALGVGLVAAVALVGWLFASYTDAHLPFWDAAASGASVVAQVLLMRRKLENWYLWIAVDILSVGIYLYKQLYLTAGLYVVFLALAIGGLLAWRRELGLGRAGAVTVQG
ncbi:MAG TPA: nicotinamide riboside transporter PnuC [Roseiflexaceae bacterium]|nr:nicotinamide riboside transporter PnuC [Roseiflexaceae bacterium]